MRSALPLFIAATIAKLSAAQEWGDDFFRALDETNISEDTIKAADLTKTAQSADYEYDYYLENTAINAPLENCFNMNSYLGLVAFKGMESDADGVDRCSRACNSKLDEEQPCRFFNSYTLNKNGVPIAQHCALSANNESDHHLQYSQAWSTSWATNAGQYRGHDHYTISNSVTFYKNDDHGPCQITS